MGGELWERLNGVPPGEEQVKNITALKTAVRYKISLSFSALKISLSFTTLKFWRAEQFFLIDVCA